MSQAIQPSTTRRALFAAAVAIPAIVAVPAHAADLDAAVTRLEAEWERRVAYAEATREGDEDELMRRVGLTDEVEDEIRALPCATNRIAVAKLRIIAREVALGERYNVSVSVDELAAEVLRFFGERA